MDAGLQRLIGLRVSDVMTKDVVTVPAYCSLGDVANRFADHKISSAPVVDDQGVCVGMVSATDLATGSIGRQAVGPGHGCDRQQVGHRDQRLDAPIEIVPSDGASAAEIMASGLQTVDGGTPLLAAARVMCAAHLHHLPVVDAKCRPIGIISTLDVVAAMVNTADEAKESIR